MSEPSEDGGERDGARLLETAAAALKRGDLAQADQAALAALDAMGASAEAEAIVAEVRRRSMAHRHRVAARHALEIGDVPAARQALQQLREIDAASAEELDALVGPVAPGISEQPTLVTARRPTPSPASTVAPPVSPPASASARGGRRAVPRLIPFIAIGVGLAVTLGVTAWVAGPATVSAPQTGAAATAAPAAVGATPAPTIATAAPAGAPTPTTVAASPSQPVAAPPTAVARQTAPPAAAPQTPTAEQRLAEANAHLAAGDAARALAVLDTLGSAQPRPAGYEDTLSRALGRRAEQHLAAGELDSASADIARGLAARPDSPELKALGRSVELERLWLDMERAWGKDEPRVIASLQRILEQEPSYRGGQAVAKLYAALISRADRLIAEGRTEEAEAALRQALALDTDTSAAQARLDSLTEPGPSAGPAAPAAPVAPNLPTAIPRRIPPIDRLR
ncbi:MAG: hypothetical protein U0821_10060 [Chloroflexota bacterium]